MLNERIMYFGLISRSANVKSLMDRLPNNFTEINMLRVSPTVGYRNSVDIHPNNIGEKLTKERIKIPQGAKKTKILKNEIIAFNYAEGHYRIFEEKP